MERSTVAGALDRQEARRAGPSSLGAKPERAVELSLGCCPGEKVPWYQNNKHLPSFVPLLPSLSRHLRERDSIPESVARRLSDTGGTQLNLQRPRSQGICARLFCLGAYNQQ
ncbi:hypothetical protein DTO271G3_6377 [Paecilomyces variotii]|nr:hypothetical protein DTO271G3_6377 [Paecilomyces variotii]